jgi:hypothetical protein
MWGQTDVGVLRIKGKMLHPTPGGMRPRVTTCERVARLRS